MQQPEVTVLSRLGGTVWVEGTHVANGTYYGETPAGVKATIAQNLVPLRYFYDDQTIVDYINDLDARFAAGWKKQKHVLAEIKDDKIVIAGMEF